MSNRPKRRSILPAKFSSLSVTSSRSNGGGCSGGSARRTPNVAAAIAASDAATGDSRSSTPVSGISSSAGERPSRSASRRVVDRAKPAAKPPKKKSRSIMEDVYDDDECDDGLGAIDDSESDSASSEEREQDEDEDIDEDETAANDDMDGSLPDDSASVICSEATDSASVASNVSKMLVVPRRPKSPEFIPDDVELPVLTLPDSSTDLPLSCGDVMLAVGVYEVLRRFHSIVRLSPFRFEDFCAAVSAVGGEDCSSLLVEIHMALIRSLLREDDGNNTTFGPYDTKDSIAIALHFVDAMTWYECTRAYMDSDPDSVEFCAALPMLNRSSYTAVTATERLHLLRILVDLFLATNAVREELTNEGNIRYDDHCRSCHRLGDLLCCDTCPAVYHLACLENPLQEVPEEEWQCTICKQHQLKGVTDCVSDVEKSGLLCRQEPLGYDRHRRKYWFMCRRIIVEGEGDDEIWYYSTKLQLEDLIEQLDAEVYEKDLVMAINESREEIIRQMQITEELTRQVQAGRKSMIDVLNEAISKKQSEKVAKQEESKSDSTAEDCSELDGAQAGDNTIVEDASLLNHSVASSPAVTSDNTAKSAHDDGLAVNGVEEPTSDNGQCQKDDVEPISSCSTPTVTTQSSSTTPKMLMVINKDGTQTVMTLMPGKNFTKPVVNSSSTTSALAASTEAANAASEARRIVTRSKTGSLAPKQFTDSVTLTTGSLKAALKASVADSDENSGDGRITRSRASFSVTPVTGFFKLGLEGKYKYYQNLFRTNPLALNKNQHTEERDKRRHFSHKFSLTPASEFSWSGSMFGAHGIIVATVRATLTQLESNIPAAFFHSAWSLNRARWLKHVNAASQPEDFGAALAMFEAAVKPAIFNPVWHESLGHTHLRRCPFLDREETRKKEREHRKKKVDEEEELQCKNTWVKYTLGIKHSVWKQKGEEYRITGQGGWFWVSVTRSSRIVSAESVGLRLVAAKLRARKMKRQAMAGACTDSDSKKMATSDDGSSEVPIKEENLKDSKSDVTAGKTASDLLAQTVKNEMDLDVDVTENKEQEHKIDDEVDHSTASECDVNVTDDFEGDVKVKKNDECIIEMNDVVDNIAVGDDFSVSEALISRTHYPRFTKPYSRLEHFLDRRLLQVQTETKQRLVCEQLVARYRTQEIADKKRLESATDSTSLSMKVDRADVKVKAAQEAAKLFPTSCSSEQKYACYSSVCRSLADHDQQSCYSPLCQHRSRLSSDSDSDAELTDSGLEDNETVESTTSATAVLDKSEPAICKQPLKSAETTDSDASLCNDVCSAGTGGSKDSVAPVVPQAHTQNNVTSFSNCLSSSTSTSTTATVSGSRVTKSQFRKKNAASLNQLAAAGASDSRPVSPSLSLQKYTQDGKIHLTADLVSQLEAKLAMYGDTRYKVCLARRAGPGRPPSKVAGQVSSRGSVLPKKLTLPPVHRFLAGHSGRRSLFILERHVLRSLARREGRKECAGFNYACKMVNVGWPYPCPRPFFRTAWRYRTQTLHNIAEAALQLRILWACMRWDDLAARGPTGGSNTVTTDTDITTTEVLKKRDLPPYCLRSEYLVRKIIVPINVPTQPREKYTPQRSGLRERRRPESPKKKEPTVSEVWVPEEQLDLWQIRCFAERLEKQKVAAQEKLALQQKQQKQSVVLPTSSTSLLKLSGAELNTQHDGDVKRVGMVQKSLDSQQKTPGTASASVATSGTPLFASTVASRLQMSGTGQSTASSSASPSVQNLRIIQGPNGQLQVQGLLPGQQVMRLPDGRLHLISTTTPKATQPSTVVLPPHTSVPVTGTTTLPASRATISVGTGQRAILIGGQKIMLTNAPAGSNTPRLIVTPNSSLAAGTLKSTAGAAAGGILMPTPGRPRLTTSTPSTVIRISSGQQLVFRPSQQLVSGLSVGTQLAGSAVLTATPGGGLITTSVLNPSASPAAGSTYSVTPQVVQQVVSQALLQTQDPEIQAKLLAMQKQMQASGIAIPDADLNASRQFSAMPSSSKTSASVSQEALLSSLVRHGKTMTNEQKEDQTRMAACMQVMRSLLDSIERQERVEQKKQRKQETCDGRMKRVSQQRLDALLQKHKDYLKKDILKKRSLLEKEIASSINTELTAALAARHSKNAAAAAATAATMTIMPNRKRKTSSSLSTAYEAAQSRMQYSASTVSEQKSKRGRQKASSSSNVGTTASSGEQLYCICRTPYDESKFYIACDRCDEWYHGSCVGVTKSEADHMDSYVCPRCQQNKVENASVAATHSPLQETQWSELRRLIASLRSHKMGWPFLEPVSASEVPDYYIVIKEPMDLQTIQNKVDYRQYTCVNDFVKDVTKMFDNCRYYNAPNTLFYRCAEVLEIYFVEKLKSLKGKI